ncbi:hypothetical protein [Ferrimonas futtsuensis]|uniref:hypothetical protein n=1 Tax=Ferrimonas futtsuensis TaxID=364764 RepID=UPI00047F6593|nr:hypothetical protein [Ferrimonas futtsuensis]
MTRTQQRQLNEGRRESVKAAHERFIKAVSLEVKSRRMAKDGQFTLCDCLDASEAVMAVCTDEVTGLDVALLDRVELSADLQEPRL